MRTSITLALLTTLLLATPLAQAHGDEDHGHAAARTTDAPHEHVFSAETRSFSVVIKYPERGERGRLPLRIYVANADTSEPVSASRVQLELTGLPPVQAAPREPGVYQATIAEPRAGAHLNAVVTVEAASSDILTIDNLHFGPDDDEHTTATQNRSAIRSWWNDPRQRLLLLTGGGLLVVLTLSSVLNLLRRRRDPSPAPTPNDGTDGGAA